MRSHSEIAMAAHRMCLAKDKRFQSACDNAAADNAPRVGKSGKPKPVVRSRMPRWTSTEVERLRQIYPDHDNLAVARELGRSVTSVANKAFQLGLHKSAALLTSIGRSNIAHRYQTEEEAAAAAAVTAPPAAASAEPALPETSVAVAEETATAAAPTSEPTLEPTVILPTVPKSVSTHN
jgi:hypothetical protein